MHTTHKQSSQQLNKISNPKSDNFKPTVNQVKKMARTKMCVVLNDIRSIHNVGAIFRTADAMLAEKLYLCGITGTPLNGAGSIERADLAKTSLGATKVVPWEYIQNAKEIVLKLKNEGYVVYGLEIAKNSVNFKRAQYKFPCVLILGNEVDGINDELMKLVDEVISIPMLGLANSLNVSTAFGICAYEILNQYEQKLLRENLG